ncbi:MAG: hypothetical protein JXR05_12075 [Flavobacteriaceae bacterium]
MKELFLYNNKSLLTFIAGSIYYYQIGESLGAKEVKRLNSHTLDRMFNIAYAVIREGRELAKHKNATADVTKSLLNPSENKVKFKSCVNNKPHLI